MKNILKKLHLWLGFPTGLLISIVCITGAILSFETEILETLYPQRYFVQETDQKKLSLTELIPIVNSQLEDNKVSSIKIYSDPQRTSVATLANGFRVSAFIDPYTGKVIDVYNYQGSFFHKTMTLHRWLMDSSRTWGKYIVGITTLLFIVIIISGIVWWVPNQKKQLKHRIRVKIRNGIKRFLHDAHSIVGLYASILLLICCLTGLMWSFDWYRGGVYKLFGAEMSNSRKHGGNSDKKKEKDLNISYWDNALANIQQQEINYQYITLADGDATVLPKSALHIRATDKYHINKKTGCIDTIEYYNQQPASKTLMTWAYALHVGSFGGIIVRILTCFASIIGATLPLTGYYIFWRKRKKRRNL